MAFVTWLSGLFDGLLENWTRHVMVVCCTLFMFILQRRRARRIFRLNRETAVVFTRYPKAGTTKTRLAPALGDNGAARAQLFLTDHIVNRLIEHQRDHRDLGIDVCYNGASEELVAAWFDRRMDNCSGDFSWQPQRGEHLGQSMTNAIISHISRGEDRVVIVGSDIPSITGSDVEEAMSYLRLEDTYDMVLGEALDGGYYLVGLNTGGAAHIHELFEGISWGTDKVYKQQFAKAIKLGLRLRVLNKRYNDVDTADDIGILTRELHLSREDVYFPRWSVVIPALNEGAHITQTLNAVAKKCSSVDKIEIVVVDGGSTDDTRQKVLQFSKMSDMKVTLAESPKGRGVQCRAGAELTTGFYLLFLHADTLVPDKFDVKAEQVLLTPGTSGGAFEFGLDVLHDEEKRKHHSRTFLWSLRVIEKLTHWRSNSKELPYGDQIIFTTRPMYERVGGIPSWPLMEDYHLIEKFWTQGHVKIVPGEPVKLSARRWEKYGIFKVTLINQFIVIAYRLGVSPQRLARWYYGKPKTD